MFDDEISIILMYSTQYQVLCWFIVDLNTFIWEEFLVGPVTGRRAWSWLWGGRYRVSQVLPFSMEVKDSLLLLLVVGFCTGPVFAVIVGVCRAAGVYMVPMCYCSNVWVHVI